MEFVINGKFTAQRVTGVQRVAGELTYASNINPHPLLEPLPVAVPGNARAPQSLLERRRIYRFLSGWLSGNLWEQLTLPLATRAEILVSLCNTGPLFKRRHVVMVHDMAIYDTPSAFTRRFRLWYRLVFAMLRRHSLHFLTVSDFSRERIAHCLRVPLTRISVIRPAVDHFERIDSDAGILARLELRPQGYCLMVGSLDPRKNVPRLLAAIEQVECVADLKFVLAGSSNPQVFRAARRGDSSLAQQVVWAGFVNDGELKALYENAICFIFPSLYEGFGLPPLEAMYCGCPVISSRAASLPEVCGAAALYCDAASIDDIAEKIQLMLHDAALRERYRLLGWQHARTHCWHDAAEQLCAALAQLQDAGRDSAESARPRVEA